MKFESHLGSTDLKFKFQRSTALQLIQLTHLPLDKMAAISQTIFSRALLDELNHLVICCSGRHHNIKTVSYYYRNFHYEGNMVSGLSYLYTGNHHTLKDRLYLETGLVLSIMYSQASWGWIFSLKYFQYCILHFLTLYIATFSNRHCFNKGHMYVSWSLGVILDKLDIQVMGFVKNFNHIYGFHSKYFCNFFLNLIGTCISDNSFLCILCWRAFFINGPVNAWYAWQRKKHWQVKCYHMNN